MLAALLATYVTTLFHFVFMNRRLNRHFRSVARRVHFRPWIRFAFPMFLIDGIGFDDQFRCSNRRSISAAGSGRHLFCRGKTIVLMQFVFSVQAAAAPRLAALIATNDRQGLAGFANRAARWAFWPSLAVGCLVLLAGPFCCPCSVPASYRVTS